MTMEKPQNKIKGFEINSLLNKKKFKNVKTVVQKEYYHQNKELEQILVDLRLLDGTNTKIVWMIDNTDYLNEPKFHSHVLSVKLISSDVYLISWKDDEGVVRNDKSGYGDRSIEVFYDKNKRKFKISKLGKDIIINDTYNVLKKLNLSISRSTYQAIKLKNKCTEFRGDKLKIAKGLQDWKKDFKTKYFISLNNAESK